MAIVIEEKRKSGSALAIISAIIIIAVIFVGSYFVFFQQPHLIEVVVPNTVKDLSTLSKIKFDPDAVVNSSKFQLLHKANVNVAVPTPGRSNPFKPF